MDQLICLHIGQAGVQLANSCWELFCLEHDLQPNGTIKSEKTTTDNIDVLFNETTSGKYNARALLIDLEPTVVDKVASGPYKQIFQPNYRVTGKEDAANNVIRGQYTLGREILDEVLEKIDRMVDECLFFKGFLVFNSIGGGTGGGFAPLLVERLNIGYSSKEIINFNVYPSQRFSTSPVEPYNALFSMLSSISETYNHSGANFVFENERLYQICSKGLGFGKPTYTDINRLIAQVASSVTAPLRFEGPLGYKFNEFMKSLTKVPRLNYILSSYTPLSITTKPDADPAVDQSPTLAEITKAAFNPNNFMADCDPSKGKYLGLASLYRGDASLKDVLEVLKPSVSDNKVEFYSKSDGVKIGVISQPAWMLNGENKQKFPRALCLASNTSSIKTAFKKIAKGYDLLYAKRAFVHWYVGEGMSEGSFGESRANFESLICDYEEVEMNPEQEEEQDDDKGEEQDDHKRKEHEDDKREGQEDDNPENQEDDRGEAQ